MSPDVSARMREDWNTRAREDAHYYVAFGRKEQTEEEFFATAAEIVNSLDAELRRLPPGNWRSRRALEIGCGPGRLLKPMSRRFGEIHGVDVADEMIRLARARLHAIPHVHVHATNGAELSQFADSSFDFVYSYAVFQHIPDREVVMSYLHETRRVLKPGGLARFQLNGLPKSAKTYDTWAGVRFAPEEIVEFTRSQNFQLLALEGTMTQYMWTSWIKREPGWRQAAARRAALSSSTRIRRITNAHSSEPVAPNRGRFGSISIWVENLPEDLDLSGLTISVGGSPARATYIGPRDPGGVQQINAVLAEGGATGLMPVELLWFGEPLCRPAVLRIIPAGPDVPRIASVSDGVNLMSGLRIETGTVKVTIEDVVRPEAFSATISGRPAEDVDAFCVDPLPRKYEINFLVPAGVEPGPHVLQMMLGRRRFAPVGIEVAPAPPVTG